MDGNNGAIMALLDEYKRVILGLCATINNISAEQLVEIVDDKTKDPDCKSVQAVLTHVVQSGYTYIIEIRNSLGEKVDYKDKEQFNTSDEYVDALNKMFNYSEKLFLEYPAIVLEEYDCKNKIEVRWGQIYDVEQLMEHAIVHILRHRRQIENFSFL